jgi:hypothetical protein
MEEIDRKWGAFKIEQSKHEEEVRTVTFSLTKTDERNYWDPDAK